VPSLVRVLSSKDLLSSPPVLPDTVSSLPTSESQPQAPTLAGQPTPVFNY
jgi:hypothetical protein